MRLGGRWQFPSSGLASSTISSLRSDSVLQVQRARVTSLHTALSRLRRRGSASLSVSLEGLLKDIPDPLQKLLERHALGGRLAVLTGCWGRLGGRRRSGGLVAAWQRGGHGADVGGESAGGQDGGQVCDYRGDDWVDASGGDDAGEV